MEADSRSPHFFDTEDIIMAEPKSAPKAKAKTRKPAARKTTPAKKSAPRKTSAKTSAKKTGTSRAKAAPQDFRTKAVAKSREALRAGLGVYGMAYDQALEQLEALQVQVDDAQTKLNERREQAEAIYKSLVKRGAEVEKDAVKAFEDLELEAFTDRTLLEEQMSKAKARFDALRSKLSKAA